LANVEAGLENGGEGCEYGHTSRTFEFDLRGSFMTRLIKYVVTLLAALVCAHLAACAESQPVVAQKGTAGAPRITTATTVRVRSEPKTSGAVVAEIGIGRVLHEVDRTSTPETVGNRTDTWRRVVLDDLGNDGWVFGGFLAPFSLAERDRIYLEIAEARLKNEELTFGDWADLTNFLDRATREVTDGGALAAIELARLRAMSRAALIVSYDKAETAPVKGWIERYTAELVYNEIGAGWLVKSDVFWTLREKHKALPLADEIAWAAARNPLPGECEGYMPCHIDVTLITDAKYLGLYPNGAHAAEAVADLVTSLAASTEGEYAFDPKDVPAEDRPAFQKALGELRAVVAKTSTPKTKELLGVIDRVGRK
jgi:hypothetical protein